MKKPVVLLSALLLIAMGVLAFLYFSYPEVIGAKRSVVINPLVGTWESEQAFYGKKDRLVFDEIGQLKSGRRVATQYQIKRDVVVVTSADKVVEYRISRDGLYVDAYLPRIGRVRYNRVN